MNINQVIGERNELKKREEELISENLRLIEAVWFLTEALLWTSGADDFKEGGRARKGWENIKPRLDEEIETVKELKKKKGYRVIQP